MNISLLSTTLQSASCSFGQTVGEWVSKFLQRKVALVAGIIFMALSAVYLAYHYGSCCFKSRSPKSKNEEAPIPLDKKKVEDPPPAVQNFEPLSYTCESLVKKLPLLNYQLEKDEKPNDTSYNKIKSKMTAPVMSIRLTRETSTLEFYAIKMLKVDRSEGLMLLDLEEKGPDSSDFVLSYWTSNILIQFKDLKPVFDSDKIKNLLSTGSVEIGGEKWSIPDYAQFRETVKDTD